MSSSSLDEEEVFLQLMSCYGLTEEHYNQQVSDIHLEKLSRCGCKQWKSLPPYLKVETIVADDIDMSQKREREKRCDFLQQWKEIEGSNATYSVLITALLKTKCRQDAEKLCEMLKKHIPHQLSIATAGALCHAGQLPIATAGVSSHQTSQLPIATAGASSPAG